MTWLKRWFHFLGFTIFSVLGNLAYELGEPVDQVIKSGTGNIWNYYQKIVNKFINFFPVFLSNWVRLGDVFYYTASPIFIKLIQMKIKKVF